MKRCIRAGTTLVALMLTVLLASATPAAAWGYPSGKWSPAGQRTYCNDGTITGSWPSWISGNVTKWNQVTGANQPKWSTGPGGCSIIVSKSNIGGCGNSVRSPGTTIQAPVRMNYNSGTSFWRGTNTGGCNFDWTTLHEFAHSNGLAHSLVSTAVMYGTDNARTSYQSDDISAIRFNYP